MKEARFDIPILFGDHHVLEITKILSEIEGINEFYISSAYNFVKLDYDESKISEEAIGVLFEKAGYSGEMGFEVEVFAVETEGATKNKKHFRKSVLYDQTNLTQGFKQNATKTSRKEWPNPGMGNLEVGKKE